MSRQGPVDLGPHVQGVHVFESVRPIRRALTLVPIYDMHDQPRCARGWMELIILAGDDSLEQIIGEIGDRDDAGQGPHDSSIARIVAKVFLYMGLAQTARIEQREYTTAQGRLRRLGPKKAAGLQRQLAGQYDRIVLGPQQIHLHGHGEVSPHLRRGHFRMQPHGPQIPCAS